MVHFLHGDDVEPHGPEFVGILCDLMSETLDVRKRLLHLVAEGMGVEVAPFEEKPRRRKRAKLSKKKATNRGKKVASAPQKTRQHGRR